MEKIILAHVSLKIAIVLNTAWNVYNFRKGLINQFISANEEVVVIAPSDGYEDKLISWGATFRSVELEGTGMNPLKDWKYKRSLTRILKEEQPDVILSFTIKANIYGAMAAHSLGIPIICNVSGLGTTFLWKGWVQRAAVLLYNWAFKRADFIFFQNNDDRKLFLEHVHIPTSKTGLVPGSGINLVTFNAPPPSFKGPIKFLMISRLIVEKGVNEFVEAAGLVESKKATFELMGKYEPEHRRSISPSDFQILMDSKVHYSDHQDDIISAIKEADVVVLPSYREGTPRTLLEAGAMSRPLIATDVAGCKEVVSDGVNGFLCKEQDEESLAQKIQLFLALSPNEQTTMAQASRKLVEQHFDETIVIQEYVRKIKQLVT